MKKAITTKSITVLLVSVFTLVFSPLTFATNKAPDSVQIKVLSKIDDKPLFQLNVNNAENGDYLVEVKSGDDEVLYKENLKGKMLSRKYLLDVHEVDFNNSEFRLTFQITNTKTNKVYVYNVTKGTRVIEEILVAKL